MAEVPEKLHSADIGLFDLPSELRVKIYGYSLVTSSGYQCFCDQDAQSAIKESSHLNSFHQRPNTALLQSCREVRQEAEDVLYGDTTFILTLKDYWHELVLAPLTIKQKARKVFLHEYMVALDDVSASNWQSIALNLPSLTHLRIASLKRAKVEAFLVGAHQHAAEAKLQPPIVTCKKYSVLERMVSALPHGTEIQFGSRFQHEREILSDLAYILDQQWPQMEGRFVEARVELMDDGGEHAQSIRAQMVRYCQKYRMPIAELLQ